MTITIEIPALDRLCDWLEGLDRARLLGELKDEILDRLKEAAEGGAPRPKFEEAQPAPQETPKPKTPKPDAPKPETMKPAGRPERPEGAEGASAAKQDAPETRGQANGAARGAIVTLADVQKAAAQMRDDGKLDAVKALFPEFGIRKLSDLKGDALQGFAARLREMGATI